ncbi:hypothetical protein V8G54_001302 [Vigna mungo]|uniref:Uncharacterized protein n=1 Tax=Vigna mungo TaxID=3915 RepID=A0AAQ3SAV9_VIGMU
MRVHSILNRQQHCRATCLLEPFKKTPTVHQCSSSLAYNCSRKLLRISNKNASSCTEREGRQNCHLAGLSCLINDHHIKTVGKARKQLPATARNCSENNLCFVCKTGLQTSTGFFQIKSTTRSKPTFKKG